MGLLVELPVINSRKEGWPWTIETPSEIYSEKSVWPKISIVTPSYNQGTFIEETLRSVLLQNYPNIEYYVIDGNSTDETVSILEKYDHFITGWVSEKDNGQSNAINKGLAMCNGRIFNWINSDDFMEPYALYHIAKKFDYMSVVAVINKVNVMDKNKVVRVRPVSFIGKSIEESVGNYNINQEGTYFSLPHIKEIGMINESFQYAMDCELWISLLLKFGIQNIIKSDHIVSNFRRHPDAKSSIEASKNFRESQMFKDILSIFMAISKHSSDKKTLKGLNVLYNGSVQPYLLGAEITISESSATKCIAYFLFKYFNMFYQNGEFSDARKIAKYISADLLEEDQRKDFKYMKRQILFYSLGLKKINE